MTTHRAAATFGLFLGLLAGAAAPSAAGSGRIEAFAGYYVPEEVDEDVSYGLRGTWDSDHGWGLMLAYETFDTSGGGFGESDGIDTRYDMLELSYVATPFGNGFEIFSGLGLAKSDVDYDVPGSVVDLDDDSLSVHLGIGYRMRLGDVLYLRPEIRARTYKIEDETVDFTASVALGFRFGN